MAPERPNSRQPDASQQINPTKVSQMPKNDQKLLVSSAVDVSS